MNDSRPVAPGIVSQSIVIAADRQAVYDAWLEPDQLSRWFGPPGFTCSRVALDPVVGGAWRVDYLAPDGAEHRVFGVYKRLEPPREIAFSWQHEVRTKTRSETSDVSNVLVTLKQVGHGTQVSVTHSGLRSANSMSAVGDGWVHGLRQLQLLLATGKPPSV